jgi:hypothetical protein
VYNNQLVSIKGQAQREPWKDRDSLRRGKLYFCNKICLAIKNEGRLSIDTAVCKEPLTINLDVNGKLENTASREGVELLDVKPANPRLDLSTRGGMVLLDNIHLEPTQSLQIVFLGYFTVSLEELFSDH